MDMTQKAGRELDEQVATRVMGWTRDLTFKVPKYGMLGFNRNHGDPIPMWRDASGALVQHPQHSRFHPSRSMDDAMLVVEKMQERCCDFTLEKAGNAWYADFRVSASSGDSAPHAICLAALSAVNAEAAHVG